MMLNDCPIRALARSARHAVGAAVFCALAACATQAPPAQPPAPLAQTTPDAIALVNRVTWGANAASMRQLQESGPQRFLEAQLHPSADDALPAEVQARIGQMTISREPIARLVADLEKQRKDANAIGDVEDKKAARQAYQKSLTRLANEAATRSLLRAVYSQNQLQEQLTWFWMNHFNVFQGKNNLRAMVGDFEERAIRPHVLGSFRDLVSATLRHPAMLRYLDNERNAAGRINENYARELMELHTLGVDGGYTQKDVQELARVLTGVGIRQDDNVPKLRNALQADYVRDGLFEFNPNRHDYGTKQFLGQPIGSRGLAEVDEVVDRLCKSPATAHFISRKLATYFVADNPSPALIDSMAHFFLRSGGNIAETLRVMFASAEFAQSLGAKFKDPMHYVVSAVRVAYGDRTIVNAMPMQNWLRRMGQPLYGRQTPDGYPLTQTAWASPGQMTTRFEIARTIASGAPQLFRSEGEEVEPPARRVLPKLADASYYHSIEKTLSTPTTSALGQAGSTLEWNTFLLASPEFMIR